MSLEYRVTSLPDVWPGKVTPAYQRSRAPFKANWSRTLKLLEREIGMLGGSAVEIAVDVAPTMLRNDGQLRADARPRTPSVIVSFSTKNGRLQFPADRFAWWQDNVDAVARALEALRMVDRYGVQQGRQYAGFRAIPATTSTTFTAQAAADWLGRLLGATPVPILTDREHAARIVRQAQMQTHPDRGGKPDDFHRVQMAKASLEAHHGGAL